MAPRPPGPTRLLGRDRQTEKRKKNLEGLQRSVERHITLSCCKRLSAAALLYSLRSSAVTSARRARTDVSMSATLGRPTTTWVCG